MLEQLKESGYNATIVSSESLHHALEYDPYDHHFFTLRHLDRDEMGESIFCLLVGDEDRIERAKSIILEATNHFKDVRGFFYSVAVEDFQGNI